MIKRSFLGRTSSSSDMGVYVAVIACMYAQHDDQHHNDPRGAFILMFPAWLEMTAQKPRSPCLAGCIFNS